MNMTWFFDLLSTALYTVFIQNLVFNGGYAASEALMLAKKPRRLWMFSAMIAFSRPFTALACRALETDTGAHAPCPRHCILQCSAACLS